MKKKRKNPAFNLRAGSKIGLEIADVTKSVADMLVIQAMKDCTFEEKVHISAFIPMLIKLIRNARPTREEIDKSVERILTGNDQKDPPEAESNESQK